MHIRLSPRTELVQLRRRTRRMMILRKKKMSHMDTKILKLKNPLLCHNQKKSLLRSLRKRRSINKRMPRIKPKREQRKYQRSRKFLNKWLMNK
jgi:hypothetical protein